MIFNFKQFSYWTIEATFHGFIVFIIPYWAFKENLMEEDAFNNDFWSLSCTSFTALMIIVTLKLMVFERYFNWINMISIFVFSLGVYYAYSWIANYLDFSLTQYSIPTIYNSPHFYLITILCVGIAFIPDFFKHAYNFNFNETPSDLLRRIAKKNLDPDNFNDEF